MADCWGCYQTIEYPLGNVRCTTRTCYKWSDWPGACSNAAAYRSIDCPGVIGYAVSHHFLASPSYCNPERCIK